MKPIKLSKKHEKMLLEMAFKLLPKNFFDYESYIKDGVITYLEPIKGREGHHDIKEMHWLEFVLFHLAPKVRTTLLNTEKGDSVESIWGYEEINTDLLLDLIDINTRTVDLDFLYDQFKLIKK